MNSLSMWRAAERFRTATCAFFVALAACVSVPGLAQNVQNPLVGLPQDWSHRHLIYSNPETQAEHEASSKAKNKTASERAGDWSKKANDPRFVRAFERRERLAGAVPEASSVTALSAAKRKPFSGINRHPDQPAPSPLVHRDWSNVMGGAAGVGAAGVFPAKFSFGVDTKSCADDFVVFTTNAGGANASGTFATRTGTFSANANAGDTVTITNGGRSLTLTASTTVNTGLNFQNGSAALSATNLALAIARNGGTVGVTATNPASGTVRVTALAPGTGGNGIGLADNNGRFAWAGNSLTGGSGTAGQPTVFALNQLYADIDTNAGCQTSTQAVPATMWAYNTGTGAIANTSPVLSLNGDQVAFVQHSGTTASLVLLKWSSASPGTIGAPTALTSETSGANYHTCTAPCMFVMALSGTPNDTNSSPYYDYTNDVLYVGADNGTLHKFTGVFNGAPAEVVSAGANIWPAAVSTTVLTSPVFDSETGKVFVGSTRSGSAAGTGRLHAVDSTIGSGSGGITSSGQLFVNNMTGKFDAPIVDSSTGKVYVFVADDFNNAGHAAIYQFDTGSFASANKAVVSADSTDTGTTLWSGMFDDTYYAGAGNTGFLYVCGYTRANHNPTLVRVAMTGTFGSSVTIGTEDLSGGNNDCSPLTAFSNNGVQYLFVSVDGGGNDPSCSGECVYMLKVLPGFDTTSSSSTINSNVDRFFSVSTSTGLSTTEGGVTTTITAANAGTYAGMTITQGAPSPNSPATTFTYVLRKNGADTGITCQIGPATNTCSDTAHTSAYVAGDTIDVRVRRTGGSGNLTTTFRVQLDPFVSGLATAGITAPGGSGGIIVDNNVGGGGSQVYYATRDSPGNAVQASQAALD